MFLILISLFCGNALIISLLMFLSMGLIECNPYDKYLVSRTFITFLITFLVNLIVCILLKGSFVFFIIGCILGFITYSAYIKLIDTSHEIVKHSHIIVSSINVAIVILSFIYH